MAQVQADGSEQQGERDGQRDDKCPANIAQKNEKNDYHQDHAFAEVVQDGVRGVVNQVVAIQIGNDFDAPGKNLRVEALDHGVNALKSSGGVRALAHEDDAFDYVVIVHHHAIGAVKGFTDLSQANFRPLLH